MNKRTSIDFNIFLLLKYYHLNPYKYINFINKIRTSYNRYQSILDICEVKFQFKYIKN